MPARSPAPLPPVARAPAAPGAPHIRLGTLLDGGLAPAFMAVVERGVRRRAALAAGLRAEIEVSTDEEYPPVRIVFTGHEVLIEDGHAARPDLRITGSLPDLVSLMVTPMIRGVPTPMRARGRAALGLLAFGHVRFEGRIGLTRRFLALIRI